MGGRLKYFILNKDADFLRGICGKMRPCGNRLVYFPENESGVGRFITRIFDSKDKEMQWHRLMIRSENCVRGDFRVAVYSADSEDFRYNGSDMNIREVFDSTELSLDKKIEIFEQFKAKKISGAADILLHDVKGRYLWVLIEVYSRSGTPAVISEVKIFLPAAAWIDELPRIYRKSDSETHFLERYLAIFQTFYEEIDSRLETIAECFDPQCAEYEFLEWIASWIEASNARLWSEEKLRVFLLRAVSLYRRRGTRGSLSEILELYTGEKPFIVENFELLRYKDTQLYSDTLLPMYGNDPYQVTVLIKCELIKNETEFNALKKIASEMTPVSMRLNFVLLEPYIFLNKFSYVGINSVLGSYKPAVLDGRTAVTLSTLISKIHNSEEVSQ